MNLVNRYCFDNIQKIMNKKTSERKSRKIKHIYVCKKLMSFMYKQFVTITVLIEFGIYSYQN